MTFASASAERMMANFTGRMQSMTLSRQADSAIDVDDPTAAPTGTTTTYNGDGYAFDYDKRDIDETRILKDDFRVIILRSLAVIPRPGDTLSIPPPNEVTPTTVRVIAVEAVSEAFCTVQVRGG